jgi:preprotein translocase SecE subunit
MQYGREVVPVVAAFTVFLVLFKTARINTTMDEVVAELKKVTWPSYPDVVRATGVVLICIAIASLVLAGFDLAFGRMIQWLMPS